MKTVFVLLAQGFEEIEALTVVDVLRRAELRTITVSIEKNEYVKGGHNITVVADKLFADIDFTQGDMIVLPGGMPGTNNLNAFKELKKVLNDYDFQKKNIAAICAAPLILGEMGLLKNKKAVCYPGHEHQLLGATIMKDRVVVSENIITSKGPGAALEFALKLVEILQNKEIASRIAEAMIVNN